jgi:urea transport system substrate-binding protein
VLSFSLAEDELRSMPTKSLVGELGCWSYFMSLKTPANKTFLKNWYSWLKTESYPGVIKEKRAVTARLCFLTTAFICGKSGGKSRHV